MRKDFFLFFLVDDYLIVKFYFVFQYLELQGEKGEVIQIVKFFDKRYVVVGYSDGLVKVFDFYGGEVKVNFSGYKFVVIVLSYDY